jgi:hypothetical protein
MACSRATYGSLPSATRRTATPHRQIFRMSWHWERLQSPTLRTPTGGTRSYSGWWSGCSRLTTPRPDASRDTPNPLGSSMGIFADKARPGYLSAASSWIKGASYYKTSTRGPATTIRPPERSSATHFVRASTGPCRSLTPRALCEAMKVATSTPDKCTSQHRRSRPSPSPGLSLCGGSIW